LGEWAVLGVYPNELAARIVAGLLENEGVLTHVAPDGPLFTCWESAAVLVLAEQLHTARWILALPVPSESELNFLATGELGGPQEEDVV
jgi:hypothetical protein